MRNLKIGEEEVPMVGILLLPPPSQRPPINLQIQAHAVQCTNTCKRNRKDTPPKNHHNKTDKEELHPFSTNEII